jgi:hypothetical protein
MFHRHSLSTPIGEIVFGSMSVAALIDPFSPGFPSGGNITEPKTLINMAKVIEIPNACSFYAHKMQNLYA